MRWLVMLACVLALAGCGGSTSASWPPRSEADLHSLAAASHDQFSVFRKQYDSNCQCNGAVWVIVPASIANGKREIAGLAKVFYAYHLDRPPRRSIGTREVFGVRHASDPLADAGTIRVSSDTPDPAGSETITIGVGQAPLNGQPQYTVSFTP